MKTNCRKAEIQQTTLLSYDVIVKTHNNNKSQIEITSSILWLWSLISFDRLTLSSIAQRVKYVKIQKARTNFNPNTILNGE